MNCTSPNSLFTVESPRKGVVFILLHIRQEILDYKLRTFIQYQEEDDAVSMSDTET